MMYFITFALDISHGQIAIFDGSCSGEFNDWSIQHSNQGFAWRPGSVSFATLEEADCHEVVLGVTTENDILPDAARVIDVPFEVSADGKIEIASIPDKKVLSFKSGLYQLRFQNVPQVGNGDPVIYLSFRACESPIFEIVRADALLKPGDKLLLTASPA